MGVDAYVSRAQLPGAAPSRRLAIVRGTISTRGVSPGAGEEQGPVPEAVTARAETAAPPIPRLVDTPAAAVRTEAATEPRVEHPAVAPPISPFSLAVIVAGGLLWLEDLDGRALAREQVQLIQAMSRALAVAGRGGIAPGAVPVDVGQFDWPMHNNRQLGLDRDAAAASLAGFLGRRLENNCRGLVLLGEGACSLVPLGQLDCGTIVQTSSTAQLLSNPGLKPQVWRDLAPLLGDG